MTRCPTSSPTLDGVGAGRRSSGPARSPRSSWSRRRSSGSRQLNPTLNAVVTPMYEQALAAAPRPAPSAPLAGVPFLVKDLVAEVAGRRRSPRARGSCAATCRTYDQRARRTGWRRAGLVILGKTNTPEFGMVPTCEPLLYGPTRNPWDPDRSTSGSSGGSAAAVASRHGADGPRQRPRRLDPLPGVGLRRCSA